MEEITQQCQTRAVVIYTSFSDGETLEQTMAMPCVNPQTLNLTLSLNSLLYETEITRTSQGWWQVNEDGCVNTLTIGPGT